MYCSKCNNDLAACTCPDLEERFESIKTIPQLHIGIEYQARIAGHIYRRKQAGTLSSAPTTDNTPHSGTEASGAGEPVNQRN